MLLVEQALADLMSKGTKTKWGNLYGFILLPFNIALREDPLDYVREAKSTVDRKKNSYGIFCTYLLNKLILKTLGIKVCEAIYIHTQTHTHIYIYIYILIFLFAGKF